MVTRQVGSSGTLSSNLDVVSSISQDSVLRPLLFDLFISNLALFAHNCHVFLFVDDCKIFNSFSKSNSDFSLIQSDSNFISDFWKQIRMQISVDKC